MQSPEMILGDRQHPACLACWIAQGLDDPRLRDLVVGVVDKQQVTIRRMTLRGVNCSQAVSFDSSENRQISLVEVAHLQV